MKHYTWTDTKPDFTEDCILITAYQIRGEWEHDLFTIVFTDGYWQWLTGYGEEYGDLADLQTQKYFTIPILQTT